MEISIQFGEYNYYRFSKPWISLVTDWPSGGNPVIRWGTYQGDEHGGEAEIIAEPRDIIRWGQKGPSPRQSCAYWGIVQADGNVEKCTMAAARKAWNSKHETSACYHEESIIFKFTDAELLREIKRRGIDVNHAASGDDK